MRVRAARATYELAFIKGRTSDQLIYHKFRDVRIYEQNNAIGNKRRNDILKILYLLLRLLLII